MNTDFTSAATSGAGANPVTDFAVLTAAAKPGAQTPPDTFIPAAELPFPAWLDQLYDCPADKILNRVTAYFSALTIRGLTPIQLARVLDVVLIKIEGLTGETEELRVPLTNLAAQMIDVLYETTGSDEILTSMPPALGPMRMICLTSVEFLTKKLPNLEAALIQTLRGLNNHYYPGEQTALLLQTALLPVAKALQNHKAEPVRLMATSLAAALHHNITTPLPPQRRPSGIRQIGPPKQFKIRSAGWPAGIVGRFIHTPQALASIYRSR